MAAAFAQVRTQLHAFVEYMVSPLQCTKQESDVNLCMYVCEIEREGRGAGGGDGGSISEDDDDNRDNS